MPFGAVLTTAFALKLEDRADHDAVLAMAATAAECGDVETAVRAVLALARLTADDLRTDTHRGRAVRAAAAIALDLGVVAVEDDRVIVMGIEALAEQLRLAVSTRATAWLDLLAEVLRLDPARQAYAGHLEAAAINRRQHDLALAVAAADLDGVVEAFRDLTALDAEVPPTADRLASIAAAVLTLHAGDPSLAAAVPVDPRVLAALEAAPRFDPGWRGRPQAFLVAEAVRRLRSASALKDDDRVRADEAFEAIGARRELTARRRRAQVEQLIEAGSLRAALSAAATLVEASTWATLESADIGDARAGDWLGGLSVRLASAAVPAADSAVALQALELGRAQLLTAAAVARWPVAAEPPRGADPADDPWDELLARVRRRLVDGEVTAASPEGIAVGGAELAGFLRREVLGRHLAAPSVAVDEWERVFRHLDVAALQETGSRVGLVLAAWFDGDDAHLVAMIDGEAFASTSFATGETGAGLAEGLVSAVHDVFVLAQAEGERPRRVVVLLVGAAWVAAPLVETIVHTEVGCVGLPLDPPIATFTPSLRFVELPPGPRRPDDLGAARRVLHLGDLSGDLLGPWLERAALRRCDALDVELTDADADAPPRGAALAWPADGLVIVGAHGLGANAAGTGAGPFVDGGVLSIEHLLSSPPSRLPRAMVLASCDLNQVQTSHREYDGMSFAATTLALGVDVVIAAAQPIDDLTTAVFVSRFAQAYADDADPLRAYRVAADALRTMTAPAFRAEVTDLVAATFATEHPPLDRAEVEADARQWVDELDRAQQEWQRFGLVCLAR